MAKRPGTRGNKPNPNRIPSRVRAPQYNPRKRAAADVAWANDPALEEIASQQRLTQDLYEEQNRAYGDINTRLQRDIADVPQMRQAYGDISQDLNQNLSQLGSTLGQFGTFNPAESRAAGQVFGNIGAAAHAQNAGLMNRNVGYTASIQNQAAADLATRRTNLLEAFNDQIKALQEGRMDITEDIPGQRQQALGDIRDTRFNQQLQAGQYELNRAQIEEQNRATQAMIDYLQGRLQGRGGGGGRPNAAGYTSGPPVGRGSPRAAGASGPPSGGRAPAGGAGQRAGRVFDDETQLDQYGVPRWVTGASPPIRKWRYKGDALTNDIRNMAQQKYGDGTLMWNDEHNRWVHRGPVSDTIVRDPELLQLLWDRRALTNKVQERIASRKDRKR